MSRHTLCALLAVALLTACGGGNGGNSSGDPAAALEAVQPPTTEVTPETAAVTIHYAVDRTADRVIVGRHGQALTAAVPVTAGDTATSSILGFLTAPFDAIGHLFGGGGGGGGGSAGSGASTLTLADYFPAGPDDTWTYQGDAEIVQGVDPTLLFDLSQEDRATFGFTLQAQADGLYFVSQEVAGGTIRATPPLLWIPNQVTKPPHDPNYRNPRSVATLTYTPSDGGPVQWVRVDRTVAWMSREGRLVDNTAYADVLRFQATDMVSYGGGGSRLTYTSVYLAPRTGIVEVSNQYVSTTDPFDWSGTLIKHHAVLVEAVIDGQHLPQSPGGPVVPPQRLCDAYPAPCTPVDGGTLSLVAVSGQVAPDGDGSFDRLFRPTLADSGAVNFAVTYYSATAGPPYDDGLYRAAAGDVTLVARSGVEGADGSGTRSALSSLPSLRWPVSPAGLWVDARGRVLYSTSISDGDTTTSQWVASDGHHAEVLVRDGDTLTDGRPIFFLPRPALDASGDMLFLARLTEPVPVYPASPLFDLLVYGHGGELSVLHEGDPLDGLTMSHDRRTVLFYEHVPPAAPGDPETLRLYSADASGARLRFTTGDAAPDDGQPTVDFSASAPADDGTFALGTSLADDETRIYLVDPDDAERVVTTGDPAGVDSWVVDSLAGAEVSPGGTLYYDAWIAAPGSPTSYQDAVNWPQAMALYRYRDGVRQLVVRSGEQATNRPGTTTDVTFSFSQAGDATAAFSTTLPEGSRPGIADSAIFLADPEETLQVARTGDAVGDAHVADVMNLTADDPAVNDHGQIAIAAHLDDDRLAILLYTPDLRWRHSASGSWDDSDNWTVGLAPAAVHAVTIDRRVTVTGPAAPTTVRTLTLANRATLSIAQGAPITVSQRYDQDPSATLVLPLASGAEAPLAVAGEAHLAGTLRLTLPDGFVPVAGDRYPLLTAATLSGTFDAVTTPTVPGLSISLEYSATGVAAVVTAR